MIELTYWRWGRDIAATAERVPHNRRPPDYPYGYFAGSCRYTVAEARRLVALGAGEDSGLTPVTIDALRSALEP